MIKRVAFALAGASLMVGAPAVAQADPAEEQAQLDEMAALMTELFQAEPLTPEQEARLPLAQTVTAAMMPDGFYRKMMEDITGKMMGPMLDTFGDEAMAAQVEQQVGLSIEELEARNLSKEQLSEASTILDPAAQQRNALITTVLIDGLADISSKLEPAMREGMSRAYAARFTDRQLADINAFFGTETGRAFAAELMAMMGDPQVMGAMSKAFPLVMEQLPMLFEDMEAKEAELPKPRTFADLSASDRTKLAGLLKLSVAELETKMGEAEIADAAADAYIESEDGYAEDASTEAVDATAEAIDVE